ncbi:MAG TPA: hypothetical protein VMW69_05675 [Spirochaetia bacterium]|nr:hypothetical protein [Spirochaetia bacterium]
MPERQTDDDELSRTLRALLTSYESLIRNELIHRELSRSSVTPSQWREMDALAAAAPHASGATVDLYTIYQGIASLLALARVLSTEVRQALRARVTQSRQHTAASSSLLEMTTANLESNVKLLLDRIADSYAAASRHDAAANGAQRKVARNFPELSDPTTWAIGL